MSVAAAADHATEPIRGPIGSVAGGGDESISHGVSMTSGRSPSLPSRFPARGRGDAGEGGRRYGQGGLRVPEYRRSPSLGPDGRPAVARRTIRGREDQLLAGPFWRLRLPPILPIRA